MTDETELAIAGVTSLHESPHRWASKVTLIAQRIGVISVMLLKATNFAEV
jgi:hypothetical protein